MRSNELITGLTESDLSFSKFECHKPVKRKMKQAMTASSILQISFDKISLKQKHSL